MQTRKIKLSEEYLGSELVYVTYTDKQGNKSYRVIKDRGAECNGDVIEHPEIVKRFNNLTKA